MFPSHLSRATVIFVVDGCQFGPSWISGVKIELMACSGLVGSTTDQSCIFTDLILNYQWYETLLKIFHHTSAVPQPFLLLIAPNLALAGCLGWKWSSWPVPACLKYNGKKLSFYWPYMIVSIIWNTSELSASYLSHATAIFVVDGC